MHSEITGHVKIELFNQFRPLRKRGSGHFVPVTVNMVLTEKFKEVCLVGRLIED